MSWFEEQIKERNASDKAGFEDFFREVAGAVMGKRLSDALNDNRQIAADAIGEILDYYHIRSREIPKSIQDMNEVLEFLIRPSGIMHRNVILEGKWQKNAIGPMLGKRADDGSVVALIPTAMGGYRFFDRKKQEYVRVNSRTSGMIDKEAIAFYKPFPLKKLSPASLFKHIQEQITMGDRFAIILAAAAAVVVGLLLPRLTEMLFSVVLPSGKMEVLVSMAVSMICVAVCSVMFRSIHTLLASRVGTKLGFQVEASMMMRVLSLPAEFFKNFSSGELANRMQYLPDLAEQLVEAIFFTGISAVFSLLYFFQIAAFAPSLTLPSLIIVLLTLAVTMISVIFQVRLTRRRMLAESVESGMSYQMISGIQKIKLSGAEMRSVTRWGKVYARQAALEHNPPLFLKVSPVIEMAISLIGLMVIYYLAIKNGVGISQYYAFASAYGIVTVAFSEISEIAMVFSQVRPVMEMIHPIMETEPEISAEKQIVDRLSGRIELNNVTFRYTEDMPYVLDNLSLKIQPGQYVAVVGQTGCGKSTLMRIILGFETPIKGAVYFDGRDIRSLELKSLRKKIGTVMQDGKLFTGDIYSNIVISAPHLTMDDAWEAAELAGIADDIRDMPMGMHTLLSEGGGGISGGQRQRLMIARAIVSKPKILLFDEATSALDNVSQKKVSESLAKLKCTRIVIAHRISTIQECDRIIVLDQGQIVEDGTFEELIAENGFFAELVKRQRLEEEPLEIVKREEE